jgi:nitrogen PTS system EIIA component
MLSTLFSTGTMELALKAQDRDAAFWELVAKIPNLNDDARMTLWRSLAERERLGSTGLGHGVALPHTRHAVAGLTRPLIIFGRSSGVDYGALDGVPVKLVFLLVSPDVSQHLQILACLTRALRDSQLRDDLLQAANRMAVIEAIREAELRTQTRPGRVSVRSE